MLDRYHRVRDTVTYTGGNTVDTKWTVKIHKWDDKAMNYLETVVTSKDPYCPLYNVGEGELVQSIGVYPNIRELHIYFDSVKP